jgi:hypothetical protein
MCATRWRPRSGSRSGAFADLLASLLHHEFRARLEALRTPTSRSAPTATCARSPSWTPAGRRAAQQRLVDELTALAEYANFERIDADDLGRRSPRSR